MISLQHAKPSVPSRLPILATVYVFLSSTGHPSDVVRQCFECGIRVRAVQAMELKGTQVTQFSCSFFNRETVVVSVAIRDTCNA